MAIGKNPRLSKGKKGGKKKIADSMARKDWFDFKAPALFDSKPFGKTLITKTTGTRIATEMIKGRIVEVSLADLKNNSDNMAWRKVKL
jgi:small subunit ribosomal protein S3Ae